MCMVPLKKTIVPEKPKPLEPAQHFLCSVREKVKPKH